MHGPFHFPFRPAPVRPAQDGLEAVNPREVLKLPVQCGVLFHVVIITDFDERLWLTTLAKTTSYRDGRLVFTFRNGIEKEG